MRELFCTRCNQKREHVLLRTVGRGIYGVFALWKCTHCKYIKEIQQ